jgi:hypothetical protein
VDSILINRKTTSILVDSAVELLTQAQITVDATLEQFKQITPSVDSILVNRNTAQSIVDAKLLFEIQKQVSVDSLLRARIPLGVSVDSHITLLNVQNPILVDSLLIISPSKLIATDAILRALQTQIISTDAILLRAIQVNVDAKIGLNMIPKTILTDAILSIPRIVRTISELRDNIFSTSTVRRRTKT